MNGDEITSSYIMEKSYIYQHCWAISDLVGDRIQ
jgi:hypothetical protein